MDGRQSRKDSQRILGKGDGIMEREVRTFKSTEIRVDRKKGEKPKIIGHAAVFNSPTVIKGFFRDFIEEIAPGAFEESIKEDDIRGLFNHDPNLVLGRNKAGTLDLEEDKTGLRYEIDPPETSAGNDTLISIERGDISGSSFGFNVLEQTWELSEDDDVLDKRTLVKVKLWDVSPVTFPAFDDTDVAVREHKEARTAYEARQKGNRDADLDPATRQDDAEDWRVIPYSRHGDESKQPEDTPWDGPQEKADADVDQLKEMSLFEDKEHLDIKAGFKGHHHVASGNTVNWNGVRSAMGVLRGARGGFKGIPRTELSKGYNHLVKHYDQFEKDPPDNPFRSETSNLDKMRMRERLSS